MASFVKSILHPEQNQLRISEDGKSNANLLLPPARRRPTLVPIDDQLATFRHMVGIHSTRSLGTAASGGVPDLSHNNLHFEGRAAPNLGIYNRVCHREQAAKRGFKWASFLINGALLVQIIVAAALTAMGAASSNHVGITAFGAINTVIAGLLTYLKGSGLPNRLRFYENEWKKVREYIEQRERDFSRPDCRLDVHEIVHVIESMYEEVKADVQTNTPDNYISVGDMKKRPGYTNPQVPFIQEGGSHVNKLKELEMKYGHKVTDFIDGLARKEEERLKQLNLDLARSIDSEKSNISKLEKEFESRLDTQAHNAEQDLADVRRTYEKQIGTAKRDIESNNEETRAQALHTERNAGHDLQRHADRLSNLGQVSSNDLQIYISHASDDKLHSGGK